MQKLKQRDTFTLIEDLPKDQIYTNDLLKLVYKGPAAYGPGDFDDYVEQYTFLTSYGRKWIVQCPPDQKKLEKLSKSNKKFKEFWLPIVDEEYTFADYVNTGFSEVFNGDTLIVKKYIFNRDNLIIEALVSGKKTKFDFDKTTLITKEGLKLENLIKKLKL